MSNVKPDSPVFPSHTPNTNEPGLSHRTYIAIHILQGLMSTAPEGRDLPKQAVELADALIAVLNANTNPR